MTKTPPPHLNLIFCTTKWNIDEPVLTSSWPTQLCVLVVEGWMIWVEILHDSSKILDYWGVSTYFILYEVQISSCFPELVIDFFGNFHEFYKSSKRFTSLEWNVYLTHDVRLSKDRKIKKLQKKNWFSSKNQRFSPILL